MQQLDCCFTWLVSCAWERSLRPPMSQNSFSTHPHIQGWQSWENALEIPAQRINSLLVLLFCFCSRHWMPLKHSNTKIMRFGSRIRAQKCIILSCHVQFWGSTIMDRNLDTMLETSLQRRCCPWRQGLKPHKTTLIDQQGFPSTKNAKPLNSELCPKRRVPAVEISWLQRIFLS